MTRSERIALDWLRIEQGDRPQFRLRFARLSEETGLTQKDAGYAVDSLRRAGFIEIQTSAPPMRRHICRVCDGSLPVA